ncbi:MAG: hypothetical protein M1835_004085 [Candelina submexicana]|nr:MAG: hypothetical protein M1835_004085 [Candelina submexicana]
MSDEETTSGPLTAYERNLLSLLDDRDCVRANPQRFVDPNGPENERSVFTTIQLGLNHEAFESKEFLTLGPLKDELGIPLHVLRIGPGTRVGHSHVNKYLPDFDQTKIFARYGGSGIIAEQFEILWYFQELAQHSHVPGMSEVEIEKVLTLDHTSRPSARYNKSSGQWEYNGWTQNHYEAFFVAYKAMKISQGANAWTDVEMPHQLSYSELYQLLNEKDIQRDTAGATARTLDQRIADRIADENERPKKPTHHKARKKINTRDLRNRVAKNKAGAVQVARPKAIYGGGGTGNRRRANMPNPRPWHTAGPRGRRSRPALTKEQLDLQLDAYQSAKNDNERQQEMDVDG